MRRIVSDIAGGPTIVDAQQELIGRWQGWQRSIEERDVDAAAGYLAEDYALELVQPNRTVFPRDVWLATLPDYVVAEYVVEEQIVNVAGDVAVVLHRARMQATVLGADRSGIFVISDVWRRQDGVWRVWRRHSTPLTAGPMQAPASG